MPGGKCSVGKPQRFWQRRSMQACKVWGGGGAVWAMHTWGSAATQGDSNRNFTLVVVTADYSGIIIIIGYTFQHRC